jgi:ribonuclease HII
LRSPINGLRDSKQLIASHRSTFAKLIHEHADVGLGWVSAHEVDTLGLSKAVETAMRRALVRMSIGSDQIIIDGNYNYLPDVMNVKTVVKADQTVPAVSAASIVAKVARDAYMKNVAKNYPHYGFDTHVGYGTSKHRAALQAHGPVVSEHRFSFKPLKAFML